MSIKGIRGRYAEIMILLSLFKGIVHINLKNFREMQNASRAFGFLTQNSS